MTSAPEERQQISFSHTAYQLLIMLPPSSSSSLPPPSVPPLSAQFPADHRLQLEPTLHSIVFQTTGSLCFPLSFISFHIFSFFSFGRGESSLGNVFLHCTAFLSSSALPSLPSLSSLPSLLPPAPSSHPLHPDSWSVRGVTGMSQASPSLSQLVDLCLRDYSARSSLSPLAR